MTSLKGGSNNIYSNLPALMSDARHFTDFDPACEANNKLKKTLDITSNYDYRQYLIKNGKDILNKNRKSALSVNVNQQIGDGKLNNNNKYIFNSVGDTRQPFGYQKSDLKSLYLTRKQLQERSEGPFYKL